MMTRAERMTSIVVAVTNAGLFPFFTVVLPLWVSHGMGASVSMMAAIEVAFGIGIFIGSALLTVKINDLIDRFHALVAGNGLLGVALLLASISKNPIALCACFILGGIGIAVFNVNSSTLRSAATPAAFRSRMAAGVAFLSSCLNPIATQSMGFVIEHSTASTGVTCCGVLILASTFFLLRNSDAMELLMRPNEEIVGAYGALYPAAFVERRQGV